MKTVYLVLLHYKDYPALGEALKSLMHIELPQEVTLKIVVVDGESDTDQVAQLQKEFNTVLFLPYRYNLGSARGFNEGFLYAYKQKADYIGMISPDQRMQSDALKKLLATLETRKDIDVVCTKVLAKSNPPRIYFVAAKLRPILKSVMHIGLNEIDRGQYDDLEETELGNCPLLFRRELLDKVGYYREDYFMYYEDTEWYLRIKRKGLKIYCVKDAIAWNMEPFNPRIFSPKKEYYLARNLLYFVKNNFSVKEQVLVYGITFLRVGLSLFDFLRLYLQRKDYTYSYYRLVGVKDFILGKKGKKEFKEKL